jgi:transposase
MIRMLLIGNCYSIGSERRLRDEMSLNLTDRWFCGLSIEEKVPDHSTFSKNRHGRFRDAEMFRFIFEQILSGYIPEGPAGGEGFAIDASVIEADANRQRHQGNDAAWGDPGDQTRSVFEYLDGLRSSRFSMTPTITGGT